MNLKHALIAVTMGVAGGANAQALPDAETGRYALASVPGGVARLDTRSGAVSTCTDKGSGWACYAMPDERAALDAEIGRLQADNDALKSELAQRPPPATGKIDGPKIEEKIEEALPKDELLPKQDSLRSAPKTAEGQRRIEIPLPSDRDLDRVMSFVENAWRRLVEIAGRMQRDVSGKI